MQSQPNPIGFYHSPVSQNPPPRYVPEQQPQQNGPITSQTFTSSSYTPVNSHLGEGKTVGYTQNYSYSHQSRNQADGISPVREDRSNMQITL